MLSSGRTRLYTMDWCRPRRRISLSITYLLCSPTVISWDAGFWFSSWEVSEISLLKKILILTRTCALLAERWKHKEVSLDEVFKGCVLFLEAAMLEPSTQVNSELLF